MTHCPTCGSTSIKPDPVMKGGSDREGTLIYYRCECRALFSRLTHPGISKPIAKPSDAPEAEA